jgi:hypothetical protein
MKAGERTLQQLLGTTSDQYIIPLFQRQYVWKKENWEQLWNDIKDTLEAENMSGRHFLGSLVCVSPFTEPGGMTWPFQVIDGQQRLITLSVLLASIRDTAEQGSMSDLATEINEYLVHKFKKDQKHHYKVFPRLRDRNVYFGIIDTNQTPDSSRIKEAFEFFKEQIKQEEVSGEEKKLRELFEAIMTRLDLVSITLDRENPFKIFKSLNSTGVDLSEADLIRNHVFMSLPLDEQDEFDERRWKPLESHFEREGRLESEDMSSFFRDVLLSEGTYVGQDAAFTAFEKRYPLPLQLYPLVEMLSKHAEHYDLMRGMKRHSDSTLSQELKMVRDLNVTTSYPLILRLLGLFADGALDLDGLVQAIRSVSGFVLRRYVCGLGSRAYNRWFCAACRELDDEPVEKLAEFLVGKGWPGDNEFMDKFTSMDLFNGKYCRAVLDGIELYLQKKCEPVGLDNCQVEHVMPQTIGDDENGRAWKSTLGDNWQVVHQTLLHTPGNLTLVGAEYNPLLSNGPFSDKGPKLSESKVYLNGYFRRIASNWDRDGISDWDRNACWDERAILERARQLAEFAAKIWIGPPAAPELRRTEDSVECALIPKFHELMNPLLRALHDLGGRATVKEILSRVSGSLRLPEDVLTALLKPGVTGQALLENRLGWARSWLKRYGIIDNPEHGIWIVVPEKREITAVDPGAVVRTVRKMYPATTLKH